MSGYQSFDDLSRKYILAYKKRTLFIILGITLAVLLFFGSGTIYVSIRHARTAKQILRYGDYDASGAINPEEYQKLKSLDYIEKIILRKEVDNYYLQIEPEETELELQNALSSDWGETENPFGATSIYYMDDFKQDVFQYNILEGNYPETDREILMHIDQATYYGYQIGEKIPVYSFEYWAGDARIGDLQAAWDYLYSSENQIGSLDNLEAKVVTEEFLITGVYDAADSTQTLIINQYPLLSRINRDENYRELQAYVQFKNHKNRTKQLFSETGISLIESPIDRRDFSHSELEYIIFLFAFFILFWIGVIIIRNAFMMSLSERTMDFGILRCMGASQRHIRRLLITEGLTESIIGCLLGIGLTVLLLNVGKHLSGIQQILYSLDLYDTFHAKINVWLLLGTILFVTGATLFSLVEPARQIGQMAPYDAANKTSLIRKESIKPRKTAWIRRIFGIEGEYAYKNLLRNRGKFITSTVGIAFSVVGIIIASCCMNVMDIILDTENIRNHYSGTATFRNGYGKTEEDTANYINDLLALDSIDAVQPIYGVWWHMVAITDTKFLSKKDCLSVSLNGIEEAELSELEPLLLEGSLDYNALQQGGVIVFRNVRETQIISGKEVETRVSIRHMEDIHPGDKFLLPLSDLDMKNDAGEFYQTDSEFQADLEEAGYITCPVVAVVDYCPFSFAGYQNIIMAKDYYQEILGQELPAAGLSELKVRFSPDYNSAELFDFCRKNRNYILTDNGSMEMLSVLDGYGQLIFILAIIISGISAVNIFNTLSSNIVLRQQEFAVLYAVGMSRKQILKMLGLEGGLAAIIGSLLGILPGLLTGYGLTLFAMELKQDGVYYQISWQLPWAGILAAVLLAAIVTLCSVWIAYNFRRKQEIFL